MWNLCRNDWTLHNSGISPGLAHRYLLSLPSFASTGLGFAIVSCGQRFLVLNQEMNSVIHSELLLDNHILVRHSMLVPIDLHYLMIPPFIPSFTT